MSEIAYANQEEMFVIAETTSGQLKKPTASDRMYSVGPVSFSQDQEFLDDEQIRATASRLPSIVGRIMPGDISFDTFVKPSGSKGTKPEHAALFKALMGAETVNGGVDVQYTLTNELPSVSIWVKKGHTVYAFRGATIESADFAVAGNAIALVSWAGKFMKQYLAGTAYCASIAGAVLTMEDAACEVYNEGMYVVVGSDDNGGAGFKILDIEPTAKTITLDGAPGVSGKQLITPWWPSAGAEVGVPGFGKLGIVTVGGVECVILRAAVSMVNNIKYYIDEKNNLLTAERYGRPKVREIEGSLDLLFVKQGPSYWYRAEYQQSDALIIPVGKVDGYIMQLQVPYAEYRTPSISGDEEFEESVPFVAVASASLNDEFKIIFK